MQILDAQGGSQSIPGVAGHDFRFVDPTRLVAVQRRMGAHAIVRLQLGSGQVSTVASDLPQPNWIECSRQGIVMSHGNATISKVELVRWNGERRVLAEAALLNRLTAGGRTTRVVFAQGRELYELATDGDGGLRSLGRAAAAPNNGEMSPDGEHVAFVSEAGLERLGGHGIQQIVSRKRDIHSVWFSTDSRQLLFASPDEVTLMRGDSVVGRFQGSEIQGARFSRVGSGVVITTRTAALLWQPGAESRAMPRAVASPTGEDHALGADLWQGGVALWSSDADPTELDTLR